MLCSSLQCTCQTPNSTQECKGIWMGRALPVAIHNIKIHFSRPLRISPCGSRQHFLIIKILFQNTFNYHLIEVCICTYLTIRSDSDYLLNDSIWFCNASRFFSLIFLCQLSLTTSSRMHIVLNSFFISISLKNKT